MTTSFFQSDAFGKLQENLPGRGKYWLVDDILLIRQKLPRGKSWLWAPGFCGEKIMATQIREIEKIADKEKAIFCRVEPISQSYVHSSPQPSPAAHEFFMKNSPVGGSSKKGAWGKNKTRTTSERYIPQDTLILDLSPSEEEILKHMKPKGRYNIKVAEKHGVHIEQLNIFNINQHSRDFDRWYEILKQTGGRDGFEIHEKIFYKNILTFFKEKAALFVAYKGKKPIGGIIIIFYGDTATYYFGASDHAHRQCMAPYLLQWRAISEAKKRGMKWYDFLGIAPNNKKDHRLSGVTDFKKKFGGREIHHPDAVVIIFKPLWYWLYKTAKLVQRMKSIYINR